MKTYRQFIGEMMTTQSSPSVAGFSSDSDDKGPTAGRSPKMFLLARRFVKLYVDGKPTIEKIWLDSLKNKKR